MTFPDNKYLRYFDHSVYIVIEYIASICENGMDNSIASLRHFLYTYILYDSNI